MLFLVALKTLLCKVSAKTYLYGFLAVAFIVVGIKFNSWIHEKDVIQNQLDQTTKDLVVANQNFVLAQDTANNNKIIIDQLTAEKQKTDAINLILSEQVSNTKLISQKLLDKINSSPTIADGKIAPVLSEAIGAIQRIRK